MKQLIAHEVFHPKWFDHNGNLKPNSHDKDSENPSTFNNIAAIMADQCGIVFRSPQGYKVSHLNYNKHALNGDRYMTKEGDAEKYEKEWEEANCFKRLGYLISLARSSNRFSHDEVNGVCAGSFYFLTQAEKLEGSDVHWEEEKRLHELNLYKLPENTKQTVYRPYDVGAEVKYCKQYFRERYQGGSPDHLLWQISQFCELACQSPIGDTSGKWQAWLRMNGLGMRETFEVATMLLPEPNGWIDVGLMYFKEEDHPINVMCRYLYGQ